MDNGIPSLDDSFSSLMSGPDESRLFLNGDHPDTEQPRLELDFSEMEAIETNLKNVNSRLTNAYEKLEKTGFHLYFAENEIEYIQSQIREIIDQLESSRSLERQIEEAIDIYVKNVRKPPVPEHVRLNATQSKYVDGLLRQEVTRCLKEKDLTKYINNALEAGKVTVQVREKVSKCLKDEQLPEPLKTTLRSKHVNFAVRPVIKWVIRTEFKNKQVKSEESNVVDNS